MMPASQHGRRGHALGKLCSSGAIHEGGKDKNDGTRVGFPASSHPCKSHLSKALLELHWSSSLCHSQLDPSRHVLELQPSE